MKSGEMKWLFPTPIMEYDLTEYLSTELNKSLLSIGRAGNTLVNGIRGDTDPRKLTGCKKLYEKFQECVGDYSRQIGIKTSYISESWMNMLTNGGSVGVHRHYDSIISAAFYPYVEPNSANLVFINPLDGFRMMDISASNYTGNGTYSSNVHVLTPETGKLVLFPSWLQHYVPPNKSNLRVTLSFNTRFNT